MKARNLPVRWLGLGLGLGLAFGAGAQGILSFSNRGTDREDRPVFGPDGSIGLAGPRYSAQLLVGTNGTPVDRLQPVGPIQPFETHGFWVSTNVTLPGFTNRQTVSLQVKVWDNEGGLYPTFESARLKAASARFSHQLDRSRLRDSLANMRVFSLPPGVPGVHPAESGFRMEALHTESSSGFCDPGPVEDLDLTADGSRLYYSRVHPCLETARSRVLNGTFGVLGAALPGFGEVQAYAGFGPGTWDLAAMSADGGVLLGNLTGTNGTDRGVLLGSPTAGRLLPLRRGLRMSGNARYVFGEDPRGDVVRLDLLEGTSLRLEFPDSITNAILGGVSDDGRSWTAQEAGGPIRAWWRRDVGWRILAAEALDPVSISPEGDHLLGRIPGTQRIAVMDADGAVRAIHGADGLGEPLRLCDRGRLLWCRDGVLDLLSGRRSGVGELLHGEALRAFVIQEGPDRLPLADVRVSTVSDDGRTVVGTAKSPSARFGSGRITYTFVARLAFPGDGVRLAVSRTATGRVRLAYPARTGIRYRVEASTSLPRWTELVGAHEGSDATEEHDVDLPDGDVRFLRVHTEVLPR